MLLLPPLLLLEALDGADDEDCLGADDLLTDLPDEDDLETDCLDSDLGAEADDDLLWLDDAEELLCTGADDLASLLLLCTGAEDLVSVLLLCEGDEEVDLTLDPLLSFEPEDLLTELLVCEGVELPSELLLCTDAGDPEALLLVDLVVLAASLVPAFLLTLVFPSDLLAVPCDERVAVPSVLLEVDEVVTDAPLLREPELLVLELRVE